MSIVRRREKETNVITCFHRSLVRFERNPFDIRFSEKKNLSVEKFLAINCEYTDAGASKTRTEKMI